MNLLTDTLPGRPGRNRPGRPRGPAPPSPRSVEFRAEIGSVPAQRRQEALSAAKMDARAVAHRRRAALPGPASAGTMDVAHSRTVRVSENPGIMRKSGFSGSQDPAPMCAVPPQRTWEPGNRARQSTGKRMIPPKTLPRPAKAPPSHVQHRRRTGEYRPRPGTASTAHNRHTTHRTLRTDLGAELDRSRCGTRPISAGGTSGGRDASGSSTPYRVDCCELRTDAHPCPSYAV